jgi:hypothetical protein
MECKDGNIHAERCLDIFQVVEVIWKGENETGLEL